MEKGIGHKRFTKSIESPYDCSALQWDEKSQHAPAMSIGGEEYSVSEMQRALLHTGIPQLEKFIEKELLQSAIAHAPWVKKVKIK